MIKDYNINSTSVISNNSDTVWVANKTSKVHPTDKTCGNMKNPTQITLSEAQEKDLKPCSICAK